MKNEHKIVIQYAQSYIPLKTKYKVFHHSAGNTLETAEQIDQFHRSRWPDFRDPITGKWIGYNFVIESNGRITQGRTVGYETAAQFGYNKDGIAISFCLVGNMMENVPTPEQEESVRWIDQQLIQKYIFVPSYNIVPHRALQPTLCYGSKLSNDYARNLIENMERTFAAKIIEDLIAKILDLRRIIELKSVGKISLPDEDTVEVRG